MHDTLPKASPLLRSSHRSAAQWRDKICEVNPYLLVYFNNFNNFIIIKNITILVVGNIIHIIIIGNIKYKIIKVVKVVKIAKVAKVAKVALD